MPGTYDVDKNRILSNPPIVADCAAELLNFQGREGITMTLSVHPKL